jgi:predicted nucleotidyltransferase
MTYTELKEKNGKKYYYRVRSIRAGGSFRKERIYMGAGLSGNALVLKESDADRQLLQESIEKGISEIRPAIVGILRKNGVKRAGIFGSYARGEQTKGSDIDILVLPPKGLGFGFAGIELELEKKLKKKVDLVSYNGISPHLKDLILKEEVRII